MRSYKKSVRRNQRAGNRISKRSNRRRSSRKTVRRNRSKKSKSIMQQIGGFLRDLSIAPNGGFRANTGN